MGDVHVLVAVEHVLARAGGQDVEARPVGALLGRRHLGVVEHSVALLREERHVHREALRRAVALVPQRLLRLHEVLRGQQRPRQEVSRCAKKERTSEIEFGSGFGFSVEFLSTLTTLAHDSCKRWGRGTTTYAFCRVVESRD